MKIKSAPVSALILIIVFATMFSSSSIPTAKADEFVGTIYIVSNGSINPSTAPLLRNGDTYTLIDNITGSIVIEKDNIIFDGSGHTVQGTGIGTGFYLSNGYNVTIMRTQVAGFEQGVDLNYSSNSNIANNNLFNNTIGVSATWSTRNTISENNVANNSECGIRVDHRSEENTIMSNEVTGNNRGICLTGSSNNSIVGNDISYNVDGILLNDSMGNVVYKNNIVGNKVGIHLNSSIVGSGNNTFYHNNFGENKFQIQLGASSYHNVWDSGYPSGGNYWSDSNETDFYDGQFQNETGSDRIGDTAYVIDAQNSDRYPLIYPHGYVPCPDLDGDGDIDIRDISLAALAFGTYPGHSRWKMEADMNQDSKIDIRDLVLIAINFGKNCLIQMLSVTTGKFEYAHLEVVKITLSYRTLVRQKSSIVLMATILDNLTVPVGQAMLATTLGGSFFNQPKNYVTTLTVTIPYWASAGSATVHVNFLKPVGGGVYLALIEAIVGIYILAT